MRHRKAFNHLGRKSDHREAMLSNMAASLIMHKKINTTLAKAKALRTYIEPLITRSKEDTTHNRRIVFSYLQNKEAVTELFREISTKVSARPGGYTRIFKIGTRQGDNAEMCLIELVDYNEIYTAEKKETKSKTARRRRGAGKKSDKTVETTAPSKKQTTVTAPEEVQEVVAEQAPETEKEIVEAQAADMPDGEPGTDLPTDEQTEDTTAEEEPKA